MAARTDFEPWTWEEAEQNRRELPPIAGAQKLKSQDVLPDQAARFTPLSEGTSSHSPRRRAVSVLEKCDQLQTEIKRGREYLAQVTRELEEHRHMLEEWPVYERHCGLNPLGQLTRSIMLNERIVEFLRDWLTRRENRLAELTHRASVVTSQKQALSRAG